MNDPVNFGQLGISGVTVAILCVILKVLWAALQKERDGRTEDQKVVLPALARATEIVAQIVRQQEDAAADERARIRGRGDG